jgi:predicted branched-subunit amino acid permease
VTDDAQRSREESWRAGLRAGLPFALAGILVSTSFGVLARDAGMPPVAVVAMSAIVFAGSAQFAAVTIIAHGGGLGAAVGAAALMNSRFLPMGASVAPSLPGGPLKRGAQGATLVDSSWAQSNLGNGRFDRWLMFGSSAVQYVGWVGGTALGAFGGDLIGDPRDLGLDAVFPAFFLSLLVTEIRSPVAGGVALGGALIALALVPFTPAGVPVLVASAAALVGLHRRAAAAA